MKEIITCPKCGERVMSERYYEECYGLVEEHTYCQCGYEVSWAYGQNFINPDDNEGGGEGE